MARKIYVLLERDDATSPWHIEFSDHDRSVVQFEHDDYRDGYRAVKASNMKIISADNRYPAVDQAVAALNEKKTPQVTDKHTALAKRVNDHALANYNTAGWDYVVETMLIDEMADKLATNGITTYRAALKYFRDWVGLLDERRREVLSTVW